MVLDLADRSVFAMALHGRVFATNGGNKHAEVLGRRRYVYARLGARVAVVALLRRLKCPFFGHSYSPQNACSSLACVEIQAPTAGFARCCGESCVFVHTWVTF
jgi:hypothetical protein